MTQKRPTKLKRVIKLPTNENENNKKQRFKTALARKIRVPEIADKEWKPTIRQPYASFVQDAIKHVQGEVPLKILLLIRSRISKEVEATSPIGIDEIGEAVGRKKSAVNEAIKKLKAAGYISAEKKYGEKCCYRIGSINNP